MPVVTATYQRNTFRVEAVRVTTTNMEEIAEWCGGRVVDADFYNGSRRAICIPLGKDGKDMGYARIGNWVTCLIKAKSFRIYKEKSFLEAFRGIMSETERFAKIHEKILSIARAQDVATYYGEGSDEVLLLVEKVAREISEMVGP